MLAQVKSPQELDRIQPKILFFIKSLAGDFWYPPIYAETIDPTVHRVLLKSVQTGLFVSCLTNTGAGAILTANVPQNQLSYPQVILICYY